jgi:NAD(P)-dependent dehydrogenase (short-subunit alcohol dehydrogenase family)
MGAHTAVELARAGCDVALTARDQSMLDAVAAQVEDAGGAALPVAADLTDRATVAAFADRSMERFGRCDVLCNIGVYQGPGASELFLDTELDEFSVSFEADVIAPALLAQRAIPSMIANSGGTIVNMSSSSVFLDPPGTVQTNGWSLACVAAKAGIDQFAGILNAELGAKGIRSFNVEPGFVAYGQRLACALAKYPGMPVSPPESIGPAVVWSLQSPDAERLLAKRVYLPSLTHRHGLLAGWEGPGTAFPS